MAPTYTMSAHLCKQISSSFRQSRRSKTERDVSVTTLINPSPTVALASSRRSPSPGSSTDEDRRNSSSSTSSSGKH